MSKQALNPVKQPTLSSQDDKTSNKMALSPALQGIATALQSQKQGVVDANREQKVSSAEKPSSKAIISPESSIIGNISPEKKMT